MKNAKAFLFSALLSITGAALADGCSSCPSCPGQAMVCNADGCSIAGVEAPTKAKKATTAKKEEVAIEEEAEKKGATEAEPEMIAQPEMAAMPEMEDELADKE